MAVTAEDPTAIADRWKSGMSAAGAKVTAGVNAVTVAPGQLAARQKDAYVAGVTNRANYWAQRVSSITLDEWKTAMINKGIQRLATGAAAAEPKFATFMGKLLSAERNLYQTLPSRGTTDANIQRAVAWMQGMAKLKGTF